MMRRAAGTLALAAALLAGCQRQPETQPAQPNKVTPQPSASATADPLAAHDDAAATATKASADSEPRPLMQAQVVLDRLDFTPGVIDGRPGLSTRNAIAGFQAAHALPETGTLDPATTAALARWQAIPATRVVTIPADFAAGPFYAMPKTPADQARMPALGYVSLDAKLAARFHTTVATLLMLNPDPPASPGPNATPAVAPSLSPSPSPTPTAAGFQPQPGPPSHFHAGQSVRVPNVGNDTIVAGAIADPAWAATLAMLGVGSDQPHVARIVVSKSHGTLKVYDASDTLTGVYTATMGSTHDPLPLGQWKINGISHNPKYHYNPALFWDANKASPKETLPSGPNSPVGVVWIDLSKPHYGIHGTPRPEAIGRAESHGCVRLTNWDAARLAQMVNPHTQVFFEK